MSKIEALIFDLDGVLVNTAKYHYKAWRALANSLGFDFTEKDNERIKGFSRIRSLEMLLEMGRYEATEEQKLEFTARKNKQYVEFISKIDESEILPGVIQFLESSKSAGLKMALGSGSKNAPLILEKTGLEHFFDAVIDGNKIVKAKPDPEVFLKGAAALSIDPKNCVVFEDAAAGIKAAKHAQMKTIGIGSPDFLGDADVVVPGFDGLTLDELLIGVSS